MGRSLEVCIVVYMALIRRRAGPHCATIVYFSGSFAHSNGRSVGTADRQCSVGTADRQGSVGTADRQGSVGTADRQGSVGTADRQGSL